MAVAPRADPTFDEIRQRVDRDLTQFLREQRAALCAETPEAAELVDELLRVVQAGGKRLRPAFCYWGYRAAGGIPGPDLGYVAVALELFHTASLVHDDIMDGARVRRGATATHVKLADAGSGASDDRYGTSVAILVGDLAWALGIKLMLKCRLKRRFARVIRRFLTEHVVDLIVGQYLDIRGARARSADSNAALRVASLKSGDYSVHLPLVLGAALAGGTEPQIAALSTYGHNLGLAFQLRDDVLGVFGDPEVTGKDVEQDLREGKRTYLLTSALSPPYAEQLEARVGRPDFQSSDVAEVRVILRESGALERTEQMIDVLTCDAKAALDSVVFPESALLALNDLARAVGVREN